VLVFKGRRAGNPVPLSPGGNQRKLGAPSTV
jgi:hypothetical protein